MQITSDISGCLTEGKGGTYMDIEVSPGSSETSLTGYNQWRDTLELSVKERAQGGEANTALISFLSKILKVNKKSITIVKGKTSRRKRIFIERKRNDYIVNRLNERMKT